MAKKIVVKSKGKEKKPIQIVVEPSEAKREEQDNQRTTGNVSPQKITIRKKKKKKKTKEYENV